MAYRLNTARPGTEIAGNELILHHDVGYLANDLPKSKWKLLH